MVPEGYFPRGAKKFDVFLCRDHICLETDLKCISSINPDTISNRIKEGSEQAARIVLDVASKIQKNALIDGLKSGCEKNKSLIEIMMFYKGSFYRLPKSQILSKKIFTILKTN